MPEPTERVTVVLREVDEFGERITAWTHGEGYSPNVTGCSLFWGKHDQSYFPWSSVLRVDRRICDCSECRKGDS